MQAGWKQGQPILILLAAGRRVLPRSRRARHAASGASDTPGSRAPRLRCVDAVYRTESRRVLATLIRLLGDFDLAEEALHDAFAAAVERWPRDGVPANPRAWLVSTGRFKAIDTHSPARPVRRLTHRDRRPAHAVTPMRRGRGRRRRGRPAPAHLHLLPSRPVARRADRADPARGLRPHHRGDRPRVSHRGADRGAADRPCQGQDPRRPHSVSGAFARRASRSDSTASSTSSIWSSTRATTPRRATRSPGTISRARRSGSDGCWWSCCPSPR